MTQSNTTIEELLEYFKPSLGSDFDKYKNHVYRVFLNCLILDNRNLNEEKYAIAALFHDIGIWTNNTVDYLEPSVKQAVRYLTTINKKELISEISEMIYWHHKVTGYSGKPENTIEVFRQADWIDVSFGLFNFGANKKQIRQNKVEFPYLGFHWLLIKRISWNFLSHPTRPLPMFRK